MAVMTSDVERPINALIWAGIPARGERTDDAAAGPQRRRAVTLCRGCARQVEELAGLTGRRETR